VSILLGAGAELTASRPICSALELQQKVISLPSSELGSGDLASRPLHEIAPVPEWWPFRNHFLLTIGAMVAIEHGIDELLFGAVASDGQHADGSPGFFSAMNATLIPKLGPAAHASQNLRWRKA
jgi:7-cyano-7-deazaguanine synthase